jgi:hypothetical protein
VRWVKPHVSPSTWQRLRAMGGGTPAEPSAGQDLGSGRRQRRPFRAKSLTDLAQEFGTDKWGRHFYTPHYESHIKHLRWRRFTLLEIGIGGYDRANEGGRSLQMWKHFFPRAQVVGLDIEDKAFVEAPRIRAYQGSQTDPEVLERIVAENGRPQVVIDDGSHRPEHMRETFRLLFPLLADDGIYALEDTQTSYWPRWGGSEDRHDPITSMALVKDLIDGLNHAEFLDKDYEPSYSDRHVVAVHCYHNLVIIEKGLNDEPGDAAPWRRVVDPAADPA